MSQMKQHFVEKYFYQKIFVSAHESDSVTCRVGQFVPDNLITSVTRFTETPATLSASTGLKSKIFLVSDVTRDTWTKFYVSVQC